MASRGDVWCLKGTRGRSCTATSHGRAPHPCRRGDPPIERPRTTSIAVAAKAVPGDPQRNYSGPTLPSAGRAGTATTVGTKLDRHTMEHDNPDSECAQNGNAYRRKRTRPRLPAFIHRRMHRGARARTRSALLCQRAIADVGDLRGEAVRHLHIDQCGCNQFVALFAVLVALQRGEVRAPRRGDALRIG